MGRFAGTTGYRSGQSCSGVTPNAAAIAASTRCDRHRPWQTAVTVVRLTDKVRAISASELPCSRSRILICSCCRRVRVM